MGVQRPRRGLSAKIVQERLGHADIAITLATYSHTASNTHRDAAEQIAQAMFGRPATPEEADG